MCERPLGGKQTMRQKTERADVVIAGCGLGGLMAAAAFASDGRDVCCYDRRSRINATDGRGADRRTTALFGQGKRLLDEAGIWPELESEATPLETMRIVSSSQPASGAELKKDFVASESSIPCFGWSLPNDILAEALLRSLERSPNVRMRFCAETAGVVTRTGEAFITFEDGSRIAGRLLIAADGAESQIREAVGIEARRFDFPQKALTFNATHEIPHELVSTEIHATGGPFTMVPLHDIGGKPASAVVWMDESAKVDELLNLPEETFESAAEERSRRLHGRLRLASPRRAWNMRAQLANLIFAERTALIAEAAHVVPPIGAQGLNMAVGDIQALEAALDSGRLEIGSVEHLKRYQRLRYGDLLFRVLGVTGLNLASIGSNAAVRRMRTLGLEASYEIEPLRRRLVSAGLGPAYH